MSKYIFIYHGGKQFESKEEGMAHMQAWRQWMQGLGDAIIDPGTPVGKSYTVSKDGVAQDGGPNPMSGLTTITAENIDEACKLASACPHLNIGGTIEVAEAIDLPMD